MFYLTRQGYPYRAFATSHHAIVSSARNLGRQEAAAQLLTIYLAAARFATRRNLMGLFQLLISEEEINETIEMLTTSGRARLSRLGKNEMIVYDGA